MIGEEAIKLSPFPLRPRASQHTQWHQAMVSREVSPKPRSISLSTLLHHTMNRAKDTKTEAEHQQEPHDASHSGKSF